MTTLFGLLLLVGFVINLQASSRVIKDNRITELGMSPALGRGYSLSNNTIQSMCFKKIIKTIPTYDLEYEFQEIDKTYMNQTNITTKLEKSYLNGFLKKHVVFSEKGKNTQGQIKTYTVKNLLAHIKVSSYYFSLNESNSQMSDAAKTKLESGDLVGFFNSCGAYYIRSLGRYASFMALFKFRIDSSTSETDSDIVFQNNLRRKMFRFYKTNRTDTSFQQEIEKRVLRINVQAIGLGKGELVNLIPTDLSDFKKTITGAVKLMQDPNSGVITSVEITPWAENTEFQVYMQSGNSNNDLRFRERRNLEENSSIISEINRISQYQLDQYAKAQSCYRILKENFPIGTGEFQYNAKKTFFYDLANKTNTKQYKTLEVLLRNINQTSVDNVYKDNEKFLFGTSNAETDGALHCMDQIYAKGMSVVNYRTIPSCRKVMQYTIKYLPLIDHYCLPEQVNVVIKPIIRLPRRITRPTPRPVTPIRRNTKTKSP